MPLFVSWQESGLDTTSFGRSPRTGGKGQPMAGRGDAGNRGPRRPPGRDRGGRPAGPGPSRPANGPRPAPKRTGGIGLRRVTGNDFELVHPRCVRELELDYAEGMELLRAGDVEAARDAFRYALQGCGDNLWVHVAFGRLALEEFRDPSLARGHFGYAYELARKALPAGFAGRLDPARLVNRPFFEAIEGLATCYEALGKPAEVGPLRDLAARLSGGASPRPRRPPGGGGAP